MNRQQFEKRVQKVVESIPAYFLDKVENLSLQVTEWPDPEILERAGVDNPLELLGFYDGWPLDQRTHDYGNCLPDVIYIFQGPIEEHCRATGAPLEHVLRQTVVHELAHYFGFDEEAMDKIESMWADAEESDSP